MELLRYQRLRIFNQVVVTTRLPSALTEKWNALRLSWSTQQQKLVM